MRGGARGSRRTTQIGLLVKPNLTSLARKALTLADEAVRSELAFGLTMPSLRSELASSLSGLFQRSARVPQTRSAGLLVCPRVTVTVPGRPPDRARGGHDPLIHRLYRERWRPGHLHSDVAG